MKHFFLTLLSSAIFLMVSAQNELQLAEKQYELKAYDLAIESFEKHLEFNPDDPAIWLKLADAHRHVMNLETARAWYRKAAEVMAITDEHKLLYGHLLCELGEYEKAKNWYSNYASVDPQVSAHFIKRCDYALANMELESNYSVKREYMNTPASDFGASYWEDAVVYASSRDDIRREFTPRSAHWTGKAKHQLFLTKTDKNGYLEQPDFLRSDLKHVFNEAPLSYAPSSNLIAYTKNNFSEGTRQIPSGGMQLSLFTAKLKDDGDWVDIKAFPFNYGNYSNGYPCLDDQGKKIYYASNRPDGYGGYDIYVSYNVNGTWSIPENMGPEINTPGNEITPFIEDGVIYFASDYHFGFGGFDIFQAVTGDGSNAKWAVKNMGTGINSSLDDYGLIYDALDKRGYFTTNRGGQETLEDIYQFAQQDKGQILIQIVDQGKSPIPGAIIDFSSCGKKSLTTNNNGVARVAPELFNDCVALIRKDGFNSRSYTPEKSPGIQNHPILIILESSQPYFAGKLIDGQSAKALDNVSIKVVDLDTYQKTSLYTDELGAFQLDLDDNKTYTIVFSKPGFVDFSKTITTIGKVTRDLGNIKLRRSSTNLDWTEEADKKPIEDRIAEKFESDQDEKIPSESTSAIEVNDKEQVINEGTGRTKATPEIKPAPETAMSDAFAVQLEAIFSESKPDLKRYANLAYLGYVYTTREGGAFKVRLGMFDDRAAATKARKEIVDQGYGNAFVVSEKGNELMHKALKNTKPDDLSTPSTEQTQLKEKPYKIRLAAYQNPRWFQRDKVKHIATIIEWPKDDWTIMLLDGFENKQQAAEALKEAQNAGFSQAYIVTIQGDELVKED